MEELAKIQISLAKDMEQLLSNMKKERTSRKTRDYCARKTEAVDGLWRQFEANHAEILTLADGNTDHHYFSTNYYDKALALKDAINAKLVEYVTAASRAEQEQKEGGSSQAEDPPIDNKLVQLVKYQKLNLRKISTTIEDIENQLRQDQSSFYYKLKKDRLAILEKDLTDTDKQIWQLTSEDQLTDYSSQTCFQYEGWIQDTIVTLEENLARVTARSTADVHNNSPTKSDGGMNHAPQQPHIKLPEIRIPKFEGDYLKWTQFSELYTQLIHNSQISNAQKMFYLMNNLSGEAATLVRHLPISDDNYADAWTILTNRYNNKRVIVTAFINRFLSQPTIQTEAADGLKTLHDTTTECVLGLKNLGINTDAWDPLLVILLLKKLDKDTRRQYEQSLDSPRELYSLQHLLTFLETRFQSLEVMGNQFQGKNKERPQQHNRSTMIATNSAQNDPCIMCKAKHPLYACKTFLEKTPAQRLQVVKRNKLCINCLKNGHLADQCTLRSCTKCTRKHNTLVHSAEGPGNRRSDAENNAEGKSVPTALLVHPEIIEETSTVATVQHKASSGPYVLLGTAIIKVTSSSGVDIECRALLDSGSQFNIVTEGLAKKLGLPKIRHHQKFQGVGDAPHLSQHRVHVTIKSRITGFQANMDALVMTKITSNQPTSRLDTHDWNIPRNIKLADPDFNRPGPVDILIGAEYHYGLLSIGQIKLRNELPLLQNTVLGWIVSGKVSEEGSTEPGLCAMVTEQTDDISHQVEKFWALEEFESDAPTMSAAEIKCENFFNQTVRRDNSGRFIVKLPFRQSPDGLGESKDIAFVRFRSIERKLQRNPELKAQYVEFMDEYLKLGHMEEANVAKIARPYYVIPHHCVLKPDSLTTKLRVVFDASAKTSTNTSLNELLYTGPKIQDELFSILLRFRMHRFVFTADIEKMYRQILVEEEDRKFQLIMWRNNENEPVKYYQLRTVTYGVTTSPYLAIKCLQRLADHNQQQQPLGAAVLKHDFYVDDVMSGSDSLQEALAIQRELNSILQSAGFKLRKWCANHRAIMDPISMEDRAIKLDLHEMDNAQVKTLGLSWSPQSDEFQIKIVPPSLEQKVTKRRVLSEIAHIFDPLGIMGPVVITAKVFIQKLWQLKLDWDAAVPAELFTQWNQFRTGLQALGDLKIPRHVFNGQLPQALQLHIFSDASEKAYGAAAYIRAILPNNSIIVRLLCAKSRVAPTKKVNIPRLELCAAVLASELAQRITKDLNWKHPIHFWTDSTIVLGWITAESSSYCTFVANRIASIQRASNPIQWRHVPTEHNPADLISRGVAPENFNKCSIWFFGPMFLHAPERAWPSPSTMEEPELEKRLTKSVLAVMKPDPEFLKTINHGNSFEKLQRIVAYIIRFSQKCRDPTNQAAMGPLTPKEMDSSLTTIVKLLQRDQFIEEYNHLKRHGEINGSSSLKSLSPFIDEEGLIRVGGRLQKADVPYDAKHQILLPYAHPITKIIIKQIHEANSHCGPQALLSITRQRFWPVKGKTVVRAIVQECVRCHRVKPQLLTQFMGDLPAPRVEPARPFITSGVDFCGPFWIHYKLRGKRPAKCYVAIFCCFVTKATHIEIVSDLSTDAFLGALKRFIGRRGHCKNIYCDNATNFQGASNKLQELQSSIFSNESGQKIQQFCNTKYIQFNFIPPRSPHFGGLWEAAVKSAKHLFQKSVGAASLTYEELETVMVEIEAILNSRPLTPLSDDPNDLSALTPGHFLIGEALNSIVDPHSKPPRGTLLQRWKLVSHLKDEFWQRWTREYLSELQHRYKWNKHHPNVKEGMMVILKEDNVPTLSWPLARIVKTIQGPDAIVRVVDVKTAAGVLRRPIHRLAPLPVDTSELIDNTTQDPSPSKRPNDNEENKDDSSRVPRKKPRSSLSALGLLLLTCIAIPPAHSMPFTIKPFTTQPGLYFEDIGTAHLISNEWNLVVYYDLKPYQDELTTIMTGLGKLDQLCTLIQDKQCCINTLMQFRKLLLELENANQLLATPTRRRIKRSPFNFIGNVAHAMFGILDSEYAEKMSKTIKLVEADDQHLLSLLKNQTSIIDSTTNIMRSVQENSDKQLEEFGRALNESTVAINGIHKEVEEEQRIEQFNSLAIRLTLIISNYQRVQGMLMDVIIDSHHGRISPKLLTPQQLQEQITIIKENLPPGLRLPTENGNLLQFYNLLTIESRKTPAEMIFQLKLPLFNEEMFNVVQVTPVPFITNGTFHKIESTAPFLLVNLHRDLYYPMTNQEMSKCRPMKDNNYVCPQNHPLYHKGATINTCEIVMLTQPIKKPSCNIREMDHIPTWTPLAQPNHWMYVCNETRVINIVCGQHTSQQTISGSGTINLSSGCLIRDEHTTIQGHNIYSTMIRTAFIPSVNFTDWIPHHSEPKELQYNPSRTKNVSTVLQKLQVKIQDLKNNEENPLQLHERQLPHFIISASTLIITIIIILYLIRKYYTDRHKTTRHTRASPISTPPTPARRTRREDFELPITELQV